MVLIRRELTMAAARDEQGRWLASGNPGGRPKVAVQVRGLAQRACPAAVDELVRLMDMLKEAFGRWGARSSR